MSDIVQQSPEWFAQRCGKATASRISDIVAKTKTGYSTSRANYMAQLVVERMTNQVGESYSNAAMEWGVENEPLEIKCPNTATHIETILGNEPAKKYYDQMQWQMACAKRSWCDFVSFDPRMPAHLQLFVQRIQRNDVYIAELESEVTLQNWKVRLSSFLWKWMTK